MGSSPRNPFVIAEAASSHDGSFSRMLELIEIAKDAGADAFKTQFWSNAERVSERMHSGAAGAALLQKYQWDAAWLPTLSDRAHTLGLEFLCTVDLFEDIEVVAPYVDRFKIASWGANDVAFLNAHAKYDKPMVISMGTWNENEAAALADIGEAFHVDVDWLLHCVSAYPAPLEECNLSLLHPDRNWNKTVYVFDGFSDHTKNVLTGSWAVCAGARVLEVHFRAKDTSPENPDHCVSLSPGELKAYIRLARQAAQAMGDGVKRCMPSEEKNRHMRYV